MSLTISGFHYMTSRNPLHPNLIMSQCSGYKKPSCLSKNHIQLAVSKIFIWAKVQNPPFQIAIAISVSCELKARRKLFQKVWKANKCDFSHISFLVKCHCLLLFKSLWVEKRSFHWLLYSSFHFLLYFCVNYICSCLTDRSNEINLSAPWAIHHNQRGWVHREG